MKKELDTFFTAIMFYTRIPCSANIDYSPDMLNKSTRYFPLVGWIVGALVAAVYFSSAYVLPLQVAILLSMAFGILLTGAFHEDGFADVCDGFGGGYTKQMRLDIMKDSRIGTYGTVGLLLLLLIKFSLLKSLSVVSLPVVMLVAHSYSRFVPVLIIYVGEYSRDDLTSKVKPIGRKISFAGLAFAFVSSVLPILLLNNWFYFGVLFLPLICGLLLMRYFQKRIDGYTGDCLGTIQQVSEIAIYISIFIIYSFAL